MSDQNTDASLADETPEHPIGLPRLAEAAIENILTLEKVMESSRLVERKAVICLRGDLETEYDDLMSELASLVDEDGNVVADDDTLADQKVERAQQLQDQIEANRAARLAESYVVKFQAMPADEWAEFEQANREDKGRGAAKNPREYERKLIARCSLEPKLTEADVTQLRSKLSTPQMNVLFNQAFAACTTGGLDVPKSLSFSAAQKQ